jgi:hypothetical protein
MNGGVSDRGGNSETSRMTEAPKGGLVPKFGTRGGRYQGV